MTARKLTKKEGRRLLIATVLGALVAVSYIAYLVEAAYAN